MRGRRKPFVLWNERLFRAGDQRFVFSSLVDEHHAGVFSVTMRFASIHAGGGRSVIMNIMLCVGDGGTREIVRAKALVSRLDIVLQFLIEFFHNFQLLAG